MKIIGLFYDFIFDNMLLYIIILFMKILKTNRHLNHPWSEFGLVENISLHFLLNISNKKTTNQTDLLNGEIVHQDLVWEDIKKNGMQEPLMIRINPNNKEVRLESGNHRIITAINDGFTHLPCATFITQKTILYEVNGLQSIIIEDFINWNTLIKSSYDYQIKLSKYINQNYNNIILK